MARGNNATTLYDYRHECRQRELEELSGIFQVFYKPKFNEYYGEEYIGIHQDSPHRYDDLFARNY